MAKPFPACIAAAAALALGGCQTAFNMVGVAVPLSASQTHNFDGSYQGDIKLVAQTAPGCPASEGERVIMVGDGVLWYAYSPSTWLTIPISYDGRIDGHSGDVAMQGRIAGNHMVATIKSPSCQTRLSMDFIYNHS